MTTQRIAVVTDSTCDLEPSRTAELDIQVIPLHIIYNTGREERVYLDRVNITPDEVYSRMPNEVPTTSTPSPHEAESLFTRLRESGFTHAIAVHISGGLSGTANVMRLASEQVSGLKTAVVDSNSLSMGLGFIAEQVAQWVHQRLDFDTIVGRAREMAARGRAFYVLKTLEYLRRGGRINTVQAAVAGVLDLKPIISIGEDGKYFSFRRVRGRRQSLRELHTIAADGVAGGLDTVAVMHGEAEEEARELHAEVAKMPGIKRLVFGQIGPVLVVHTGPGLVGVAMTRA